MSKLRSRKFWFGLGGAVVPILAGLFSESVELGEALKLSTGAVVAYLAAQAGVDLDEEAVNLVRFQQAFQASGRVMQVASDIFDSILGIR